MEPTDKEKPNENERNHEEHHRHPHGPLMEHSHEEEHHPLHLDHENFWHAWREEQHRVINEAKHEFRHPLSQDPTPEEIGAWRDYFKKAMGNWPEEHWIFGGRRFSPWHQGIDNFNPFVASLLSKGGGLLPLYVLHLVSQKPRYGNEIMDILAERTGGQWVSNPGAIYPLLTLLEREGFIAGQWEDPQKRTVRVYTLTATGKEELDRVKGIMSPKIDETIKVLQEFLLDLKNEPESPAEEPAEQSNLN
jgi:DNA-binding PadR family transcriptional regulator